MPRWKAMHISRHRPGLETKSVAQEGFILRECGVQSFLGGIMGPKATEFDGNLYYPAVGPRDRPSNKVRKGRIDELLLRTARFWNHQWSTPLGCRPVVMALAWRGAEGVANEEVLSGLSGARMRGVATMCHSRRGDSRLRRHAVAGNRCAHEGR